MSERAKATPPSGSKRRIGDGVASLFSWPFGWKNYAILIGALLVIVLGYVLMATGKVDGTQSLTVAPLLLVFGYLVLVPLAILWGIPFLRGTGRAQSKDTGD